MLACDISDFLTYDVYADGKFFIYLESEISIVITTMI